MLKKSSWLHLRIPFSFFLAPVFLFAFAVASNFDLNRSILVFVIIHIFLYPASNGYNSYFDKDEDSIGGLEKPPPVSKGLYYLSLLFDAVALLLGMLISWQFTIMLFIYGMVSKAYSHPTVRIKKFPYGSWFIAGFFQGFFTFWMSIMGLELESFEIILKQEIWIPAFLSSAMLWGSYPMTQIYQHEEDSKRGDITLSLKLGIKGTFTFTMAMFSLSAIGFVAYFYFFHGLTAAITYLLVMGPVLGYFLYWRSKVWKDEKEANFRNTMNLNLLSSLCLNVFFISLFFI
ncbi:MAG: UbiA family prenyltransferase [Bacteroidia bacterium]|nr:UbiA family prenyltransferase [Bacteroidia bacterium]